VGTKAPHCHELTSSRSWLPVFVSTDGAFDIVLLASTQGPVLPRNANATFRFQRREKPAHARAFELTNAPWRTAKLNAVSNDLSLASAELAPAIAVQARHMHPQSLAESLPQQHIDMLSRRALSRPHLIDRQKPFSPWIACARRFATRPSTVAGTDRCSCRVTSRAFPAG